MFDRAQRGARGKQLLRNLARLNRRDEQLVGNRARLDRRGEQLVRKLASRIAIALTRVAIAPTAASCCARSWRRRAHSIASALGPASTSGVAVRRLPARAGAVPP